MTGQMTHKVLCTKPLYDASAADASMLGRILEEFGVRDKVLAVTAENESSVDILIGGLQIRRLKCFASILSLAAQKALTCRGVIGWASKMRAAAVRIRGSSSAQHILQEKQKLFSECPILPLHEDQWQRTRRPQDKSCTCVWSFSAAAAAPTGWCPVTLGLTLSHGGAVCGAVCCHSGHFHRSSAQRREKVVTRCIRTSLVNVALRTFLTCLWFLHKPAQKPGNH